MSIVFVAHPYVSKAISPGSRWVRRMEDTMRRKLQGPLARELAALGKRVEVGALERAVDAGNAKRVVELSLVNQVGSIVASLGETLQDPMLEGANIALQELGRAGIALDMFRPRLERWIERHTAQLVREVNGTSRAAVRAVLVDGIKNGRHPRALAKDIRQIVGLTEPQSVAVARRRQAMLEAGVAEADVERRAGRYAERLLRQRAMTIAQHETMTAINGGRHELWKQLAADGEMEPGDQRQWLTAVDEAVCPICKPMDQQVTTITGQYLTPRGDLIDHPPAHVRCLVPGTMVRDAMVRAATRRSYCGDVIQIESALGTRLTVTPNHPILTPQGFVSARMIRQGDSIFGRAAHESMPLVDPNDQHVPSAVEQVFDTLRLTGQVRPMQVPSVRSDFHGDGSADGDTDIVWAAGVLDRGLHAKLLREVGHREAQRCCLCLISLARFCSLFLLRGGLRASLGSRMRGGHLSSSLPGVHATPLDRLGLALAAQSYPGALEPNIDHASVCPVCLGQGVGGFSGKISLDNFAGGNVDHSCVSRSSKDAAEFFSFLVGHCRIPRGLAFLMTANLDASAKQAGPDGAAAHRELFSDASNGKSAGVQAASYADQVERHGLRVFQVRHVSSTSYRGYVYNVETRSGLYTAGGIAASNCRCTDVII